MIRAVAGFVLMMIASGGALSGQTADPAPAFEAVSIRPSPPNYGPRSAPSGMSGGPGTADPERLTIRRYNVQSLIVWAYNLAGGIQISGLDKIPEADGIPVPWIQFDPFDIIAKVPPGATEEQLRLMFQKMLAERFGLKVHFEKKEMPSYDLVVAKAGVISRACPVSRLIRWKWIERRLVIET